MLGCFFLFLENIMPAGFFFIIATFLWGSANYDLNASEYETSDFWPRSRDPRSRDPGVPTLLV